MPRDFLRAFVHLSKDPLYCEREEIKGRLFSLQVSIFFFPSFLSYSH